MEHDLGQWILSLDGELFVTLLNHIVVNLCFANTPGM